MTVCPTPGSGMNADPTFAPRVLEWFDQYGRHDLPWQVQDPYPVWVSEVMLQQTQVKTVLAYFPRFLQRFPTVEALAQASWEDVASHWAGLGYYARARNLHRAARQVAAAGAFPDTLAGWMALPGVGRSTAGAIMALGLGRHGVILDGNVRRVLCRYFAVAGDPLSPTLQRELWTLVEALTPTQRTGAYTQAMMDLGATVCTPRKPLCLYCPLQSTCQAHQQGRELDFPQKKTRAPLPVRQSWALQVQQGDHWLWELRPASGLWGGLLCLPLLEVGTEGLPEGRAGVQIEHVLTHLRWQLQLWHCAGPVDALEAELAGAGRELRWLTPAQALAGGVPTAMKRLLQTAGQAG